MVVVAKLIELLATIALKLTEMSFRLLWELAKVAFSLGRLALTARKEGRDIPAPSKRRRRR